jgi:hypothetical protein
MQRRVIGFRAADFILGVRNFLSTMAHARGSSLQLRG